MTGRGEAASWPRRGDDWTLRNRQALALFLERCRPGEVAVFDWDNTCGGGDIGDAFFWEQGRQGAFLPPAAELVRLLDDAVRGRTTLRFSGGEAPIAPWRERLAAGGDLFLPLAGIVAALSATAGLGDPVAFAFQAALLAGEPAEAVARRAGEIFLAETKSPARSERAIDPASGEEVYWRSGLRPYPPMAGLAADLRRRGVEVAIVSATATPVVRGAVAAAGFSASEVLGQDPLRAAQVLRGQLDPAAGLVHGPGKVSAIRARFATDPVLVAGDSPGDVPMLTAFPGTRLRLLIDRGRSGPGVFGPLLERARSGEEGWLAQPADPDTGLFLDLRSGVSDPVSRRP
ncbi:MAG TPA: HAD family hydrolase [Candidatus Aminicenantes bacterium]|nr:HAD family hydrolase [Candidatus Aminicenantes bacterium]